MRLIWIFIFLWTIVVIKSQFLPNSIGMTSDACLDQALQRWNVPATSRFSQFAAVTLAMPSARHLYESLFTQMFTPQLFKEYCKNYQVGRSAYERCPNSIQKTVALAGYGLADYICIQRVEDFANNLPCLQNIMMATLTTCNPQCVQFEQASKMYLSQPMGLNSKVHMAGDCRYLKCMADCRIPQAAAQCGQMAGALVQESMQTVINSVRKQYESAPGGALYQNVIPDECLALTTGLSPISSNPWSPFPNPSFPVSNPFPSAVPFPTTQSFPNPNPNLNPFPNSNPGPFPNPGPYPNPNPMPPLYPNPVVPRPYWASGTRVKATTETIFILLSWVIAFRLFLISL